jgi:DNA polymerase
MGGEHDRLTAAEAASVIGWWIEAGVDVATQERPRAWLSEAGHSEAAGITSEANESPLREQAEELPSDLDAFRSWFAKSPTIPLAQNGLHRVLPKGLEASEIMLMADMPMPDDVADDQPIGGAAWELTERMLAAIGFSADQAYVASLTCSHSAGTRLAGKDLEACAAIARRHIALARPKRLLLLGDTPCKALLGKPFAAARGHVHKIEGVRTVATFHPRWLLERASDKPRAWSDLLLLMEEEV